MAAADGYKVSDISILLSEELVNMAEDLAGTACSGRAKLKPRRTYPIQEPEA